jgi:hypothetical protein
MIAAVAVLGVLVRLLLAGGGDRELIVRAQLVTPPPSNAAAPIGVATMEPDGTIVLRLRATGPGGLHGEGLMRYPVSDARYRDILRHIGPLEPGETKPVPPWPD